MNRVVLLKFTDFSAFYCESVSAGTCARLVTLAAKIVSTRGTPTARGSLHLRKKVHGIYCQKETFQAAVLQSFLAYTKVLAVSTFGENEDAKVLVQSRTPQNGSVPHHQVLKNRKNVCKYFWQGMPFAHCTSALLPKVLTL